MAQVSVTTAGSEQYEVQLSFGEHVALLFTLHWIAWLLSFGRHDYHTAVARLHRVNVALGRV